MKTGILNKFKEFANITNIFEKEKNHIKLKSLLKIVARYNPDKVMKYRIRLEKEKSGG